MKKLENDLHVLEARSHKNMQLEVANNFCPVLYEIYGRWKKNKKILLLDKVFTTKESSGHFIFVSMMY